MADPQHSPGGPNRPEPGPDAGVADLEADIETTRKELGETVQALSDKLDVKERARVKVAETREQAVHRAQEISHDDRAQRGAIIAAVVTVAVVGLILWRRRR
ncbi:DUF3618 domain-containing protein [Mycolicibacterium thermoresistibile]